jgi:hypothetical protein
MIDHISMSTCVACVQHSYRLLPAIARGEYPNDHTPVTCTVFFHIVKVTNITKGELSIMTLPNLMIPSVPMSLECIFLDFLLFQFMLTISPTVIFLNSTCMKDLSLLFLKIDPLRNRCCSHSPPMILYD